MKKNVCICMSGLVRTLNECYTTLIDNVVKANPNYNFDIVAVLSNKENTPIDLSEYNFKKYIISIDGELPDLKYQYEKIIPHQWTFPNNYYQLMGLRDANKLRIDIEKGGGFEYDMIIRVRTDLKFYDAVSLENLDITNKIYIPHGNDYCGGYNDRFALGNRDLMNHYMNRFDFWMNRQDHIPEYSTHAELNLKQFLDEFKINMDRIPFSYCLRRDGFDFNIHTM
jgi:hypothetical protein